MSVCELDEKHFEFSLVSYQMLVLEIVIVPMKSFTDACDSTDEVFCFRLKWLITKVLSLVMRKCSILALNVGSSTH